MIQLIVCSRYIKICCYLLNIKIYVHLQDGSDKVWSFSIPLFNKKACLLSIKLTFVSKIWKTGFSTLSICLKEYKPKKNRESIILCQIKKLSRRLSLFWFLYLLLLMSAYLFSYQFYLPKRIEKKFVEQHHSGFWIFECKISVNSL